MNKIGEHWSFVWLVVITIDILGGVLMICSTLKHRDINPISVEVEHFEQGSYKVPETKSAKHIEELEVGTIVCDKDVELLARLINGESGSNWCSDKMQLGVGSVVLNRMKSDKFPNTMEEVIFQNGQYSCTKQGGGYWLEPSERAYKNARELLTKGSIFPDKVLFQANFTQGKGTYLHEQNMYFCY